MPLTTGLGQAGSFFMNRKIKIDNDASFSTSFTMRFSRPMGNIDEGDRVQGADGVVFVVQNYSDRVGGTGGGIGYNGIPRSVGVEFDTWRNTSINDINGNHLGINLGGNIRSRVQRPVGFTMNDGQEFYAWVDYNGKTKILEARISRNMERPTQANISYNVDLMSELQSNEVYVGFTSGTGSSGNYHIVSNWRFVGEYDPQSVVIDKHLIEDACARNNLAVNDPLLEYGSDNLRPDLLEGADEETQAMLDCFEVGKKGDTSASSETPGVGSDSRDQTFGGEAFAKKELDRLANSGYDDGAQKFGLPKGSFLRAKARGINPSQLAGASSNAKKMDALMKTADNSAFNEELGYIGGYGGGKAKTKAPKFSLGKGQKGDGGDRILFGKKEAEGGKKDFNKDANAANRNLNSAAADNMRDDSIFAQVSRQYDARQNDLRTLDSYIRGQKSPSDALDLLDSID